MEHAGLRAYVRFAVAGCLAVSSGCAPLSGEQDASPDNARGADSTRRAVAQRNRSSATQGIDFDESERGKYTRVELMIQARFAGVQVTQSGSGFTIKVRGTGSFTSSNEPLIVVDGALRSTGSLSRISPLDVERIEVVKDGTASFYGSRGANGVILITTRRTP
jgi:TonB-dependent SusC/RagA subfamily outer membrane receptor